MQYSYEELKKVDLTSEYRARGFSCRSAYLVSLANDYGINPDIVFALADTLGRSEDFDALISSIEEYIDYID
jgi:hypothetical protein